MAEIIAQIHTKAADTHKTMNNIATQDQLKPVTLRNLIAKPEYQKRFQEVLGKRAPQFITSVLSIGRTMPDVEPVSIITSAMTSAALDLPVDKNLGFAWLVPYRNGNAKYCQFQMGWKGLVQLGLRSGQYSAMNVRAANKEVFQGYDSLGEPTLDWKAFDATKEVAGYFFGWRLINGFEARRWWWKEEIMEHAKRYSQAYRKGSDTPWKTHFDAMAKKTVVANELRRWGILSIEMQTALKFDQAIQKDLDAEPINPDAADFIDVEAGATQPEPQNEEPPKEQSTLQPAPQTTPEPAAEGPNKELESFITANGFTFQILVKWAGTDQGEDSTSWADWSQIPAALCKRWIRSKVGLLKGLEQYKEAK